MTPIKKYILIALGLIALYLTLSFLCDALDEYSFQDSEGNAAIDGRIHR